MVLRKHLAEYWQSFSFIGLVSAILFFSASVTPSLLPRPYLVQGILSALAIATGYGLGVGAVWIYRFLEFPRPNDRVQAVSKVAACVSVAIIFVFALWQMTFWQNSVRELMEMPIVESSYPYRFAAIAVAGGTVLIAFARFILWLIAKLARQLNHVLPRRVSIVISGLAVGVALLLIGNGIVARALLDSADRFFSQADGLIDGGVEQPAMPLATGSHQSLITWESIGREGKNFLVAGPTQAQISQFHERQAMQPLRVYVGMRSRDTARERAELALKEMLRVGAFDRSVLVVATPTGTGWLDPGGVDSLEYLHAGDTAVVSTQYSYLPSWITILVDPRRSIESAYELFDVVYGYWRTLPPDHRPKLFLHGLSLGALGSEVSADLYATFEDPIQGAVWSGPPFPSTQWQQITAHRNLGSPSWLPTYRDQRLIRFTSRKNDLTRGRPWGPIRNVYIQHASDPMVFFSSTLFYKRPPWLAGERGPDVSPHLTWYPIITGLQIAFDLPMATSVPMGFGHNYAPASYIDAWIAVSQPRDWSARDTAELKKLFLSSATRWPGST